MALGSEEAESYIRASDHGEEHKKCLDLYMYASMCAQTYEENESKFNVLNWEVLDSTSSTLSNYAYKAVAFINHKDRQVIVAHRGTVSGLENWTESNVPLIIRREVPAAYNNEVVPFSQKIRGLISRNYAQSYTFTETGHSLGGMYAQLNGYVFGEISISFDSPGVGFLRKELKRQNSVEPLHYNFVTAPNIVNVSGDQYGEWIRIFPFHISEDTTSFNDLLNLTTTVTSPMIKKILGFDFSGNEPAIFNLLSNQFFMYDLHNHSMVNILRGISSEVRQPYLQARVESWPSLSQYLQWRLELGLKDFEKSLFGLNRRQRNANYEIMVNQFPNYSVTYLIAPKLFAFPDFTVQMYMNTCLDRFETFFPQNKVTYNSLKEWFSALSENVSEVPSTIILFSLINSLVLISESLSELKVLHALHAVEFNICEDTLQGKNIGLLVSKIIPEQAHLLTDDVVGTLAKIGLLCENLSIEERKQFLNILGMSSYYLIKIIDDINLLENLKKEQFNEYSFQLMSDSSEKEALERRVIYFKIDEDKLKFTVLVEDDTIEDTLDINPAMPLTEDFLQKNREEILEMISRKVNSQNSQAIDSALYDFLLYQANEAVGGVIDNISGTINTVLHPIQTIQSLTSAVMHPIETGKAVCNQAYNHPVRFASSLATGWVIGKGIKIGVGKVGKYVSGAEKLEQSAQNAVKAQEAVQSKVGTLTTRVAESTDKIREATELCSDSLSAKLYGQPNGFSVLPYDEAVKVLDREWGFRHDTLLPKLQRAQGNLLEATEKANQAKALAEQSISQIDKIQKMTSTATGIVEKSMLVNQIKKRQTAEKIYKLRPLITTFFQLHFYESVQHSSSHDLSVKGGPAFFQKQIPEASYEAESSGGNIKTPTDFEKIENSASCSCSIL